MAAVTPKKVAPVHTTPTKSLESRQINDVLLTPMKESPTGLGFGKSAKINAALVLAFCTSDHSTILDVANAVAKLTVAEFETKIKKTGEIDRVDARVYYTLQLLQRMHGLSTQLAAMPKQQQAFAKSVDDYIDEHQSTIEKQREALDRASSVIAEKDAVIRDLKAQLKAAQGKVAGLEGKVEGAVETSAAVAAAMQAEAAKQISAREARLAVQEAELKRLRASVSRRTSTGGGGEGEDPTDSGIPTAQVIASATELQAVMAMVKEHNTMLTELLYAQARDQDIHMRDNDPIIRRSSPHRGGGIFRGLLQSIFGSGTNEEAHGTART